MRINQYELIKLYNDCVDKRDFINSCIDKYSIETSAWENYWDLIDATIDIEAPPSKAESAETPTNKQTHEAIALLKELESDWETSGWGFNRDTRTRVQNLLEKIAQQHHA